MCGIYEIERLFQLKSPLSIFHITKSHYYGKILGFAFTRANFCVQLIHRLRTIQCLHFLKMPDCRSRLALSTRTLFVLLTLTTCTFLFYNREADWFAKHIRSRLVASQGSRPPISVVVLFHREYETFNSTLQTWEQNGLVPFVSELVVFMNGMSSEDKDSFFEKIPRLKEKVWEQSTINLINSEENMPLGLAIGNASELAQNDIILLLEKDWALIESGRVVQNELENSVSMLVEGIADAVRLRHRENPGIPDFGRLHGEGHEDDVMVTNKPTVCNFHKWMDNLNETYPSVFQLCGNSLRGEKIWCANSEYCEWTNNPVMFKKQWYRDALKIPYGKHLKDIRESDPSARIPIFENWVRYESDWAEKQYVIALPHGLFQHKEIGEESFFNKVYSPWRRLHNDVNGAIHSYFRTYQRNCKMSHDYGRKIRDIFPVKFIQQFYFKDAMKLSESQIVTAIRKDVDCKIDELLEKRAYWFKLFQDLSESWISATLSKFPVDPEDMKVTFVSHISDSSKKDDKSMLREIKRFCSLLNYLRFYDNVVYSTPEITRKVKKLLKQMYSWTEKDFKSIIFFESSEIDLISRTIGSKNLELLNDDTNNRTWSSSASLFRELITPLLVREVSRNSLSGKVGPNIARSTHFVWIDPQVQYERAQSQMLSNNSDHVIRGNLLLNPMVIGSPFDSKTNMSDVLGNMKDHEEYLSPNPRIVSGSTVAGSRTALESFVGYYEILLSLALKKRIIPSRMSLTSIISNIRGIDIPVRFASFENFELKSDDLELFIYARNCSANT